MVYITSHLTGFRKTWNLMKEHCTYQDVMEFISNKESCREDIILYSGRRRVLVDEVIPKDAILNATLVLRGGKGGFGSMLRAIGAQIEKTTNREACRDLSGRRLRDINEEKRLKEYLSKKVDKERDTIEKKRKKLEQLKEGPKHFFEDKAYMEQREKREQDIFESLDKAHAKATSSSSKRKLSSEQEMVKIKKNKMMADDFAESSGSESEENEPSDAVATTID